MRGWIIVKGRIAYAPTNMPPRWGCRVENGSFYKYVTTTGFDNAWLDNRKRAYAIRPYQYVAPLGPDNAWLDNRKRAYAIRPYQYAAPTGLKT
ncbi:hypothetical protein CHT99_19755 [Sphingobacterium cellulitidis]|nr:hypothetical protein CHT99_19755 [Sphingobacterium cellulitidis]